MLYQVKKEIVKEENKDAEMIKKIMRSKSGKGKKGNKSKAKKGKIKKKEKRYVA